jgi:MerC mercury resistance protein
MSFKTNWDSVGIITSITCAIHCVVLPLAFTSLPLFGINIIHNAVFEWAMILLAFLVGIYSLWHGFKTHHKNYLPIKYFAAGFVLLIAKQFFTSREIWFIVPAVSLIILAHYTNYKLCTKNKCTSPHHTH